MDVWIAVDFDNADRLAKVLRELGGFPASTALEKIGTYQGFA